MHKHYYFRLAKDNIKKNPRMYIPYLITSMLTSAMLYIILSLSVNPDLANMKKGARTLPIMLNLGSIVTMVFAFIFLFYTNSFIVKRRRKEFGLLNILGMEKRHIAKMLLAETGMVIGITLAGGFVLGIVFDKLLFLSLTKMIGESATLGFHISGYALCVTGLFNAGTFFLIFLNMLRQIHLAKPVELLSGSNAGEKEPKTKILMTILGLGLIGAGYTMSIMAESPMTVVNLLFIAVLCVILGTYLLFTAVSIAVCKLLKRNKKYYYKTNHFTAVSGLIYRMKRNAVGLASVCILSTMVLVMVSTTSALMIGLDDAVNRQMKQDAQVTALSLEQGERFGTYLTEHMEIANLHRNVNAYLNFKGEWAHPEIFTDEDFGYNATYDNYYLKPELSNQQFSVRIDSSEGGAFTLADDECYLATENPAFAPEEITLLGRTFRVQSHKVLESESAGENVRYNYYQLIFNSHETVVELLDTFNKISSMQMQADGREEFTFDFVSSDKRQAEVDLTALVKAFPIVDKTEALPYCDTKLEMKDTMLEIYGGLFFLGIFLGTLFLMETVLIIYYKQITEGYEDQKRFEIMQNVGMSRSEVVRSIRSQILIVFFLPLVTAGLHTGFAFPILSRLLKMMELSNTMLYVMCVVGCFAAFAVLYSLIYLLTARTYYKIVKK